MRKCGTNIVIYSSFYHISAPSENARKKIYRAKMQWWLRLVEDKSRTNQESK
jgi:hypothetical protein